MAYYTRKTFNDAWGEHPLDGNGPSGLLKFMRRRRTPWAGLPEKAMTIMGVAMAPVTGGMSLAPLAAWHLGWGALSAPSEVGRAAVQAVRFLTKLGQSGPEFAGPMVDTRMAYTMRQSALQAMHNSAYSLRGAVGNEARMLHS